MYWLMMRLLLLLGMWRLMIVMVCGLLCGRRLLSSRYRSRSRSRLLILVLYLLLRRWMVLRLLLLLLLWGYVKRRLLLLLLIWHVLILISLLIAPLLRRNLLLVMAIVLCLLLRLLLGSRRSLLCLLLLILQLQLPLPFLSLPLNLQLLLLLLGLLLELLLPAVPLAGANFLEGKLHGGLAGVQVRVDVSLRVAADTVRVVRFLQAKRDVPPFVVGACFAGEPNGKPDGGWFWIDDLFLLGLRLLFEGVSGKVGIVVHIIERGRYHVRRVIEVALDQAVVLHRQTVVLDDDRLVHRGLCWL